jgi:signal transduction histidine kinase
MQRLDLNGIVSRIAESMSGTAFERGATIEIDELPAAWGDATAVEQIFANLIGNALKFLDPQRPGAVRIGTIQEETAEGTETPPGSWHTYYVKDNGLGISPGVQPKLFQAFKRFHPHVAEGEGMGLAIVRRMVERHGGRVRVESAVGSGTVFYVTLPAQRGSETAGKNNTSEAKWEEIHGERTVGHCVSGR